MKLARDTELSRHEAAAEVVSLDKARAERRRAHVQAAVEGLVWTEAEPDEREDFMEVLGERLDAHDLADPDEPIDAVIHRIARDIGLKDPPPQGEVSPKVTEGVAAHEPNGPASQPPQPVPDSSPSGGASDDDDLCSDSYWRSSA